MWVWWWYAGRRHRYFHSFSIRIANNRPKCLFIIKIFFRLFRFLFSILYLVHRRRQITETKYIHTRWGKSFICKLANAATKLVQRFVYYKRALNQTFLHVCERKIKLFACRCSVWVVRFGMNVLYVRNTGAPSDTKKKNSVIYARISGLKWNAIRKIVVVVVLLRFNIKWIILKIIWCEIWNFFSCFYADDITVWRWLYRFLARCGEHQN